MMAALMMYAVAIGLTLAAVSVMLERVAALNGHPRRWVWVAMLCAMVLLIGALPWRAVSPSRPASVAESDTASLGHLRASPVVSPGIRPQSRWSVARDRLRAGAGADAAAAAATGVDAFGRWMWMSASLAIALVYGLGQWTLSRRRRQWRVDHVHGVSVLVAPQDGPAVIGVLSPRIVLPEWALALEPQAIDLMIRHEREHDAARDPLLMHLAGLALLLMPWNPATWWMVSRLRLAVELDCDARVLGTAPANRGSVSREASVYGELLLAVAARRSPRRAVVAPALLEHSSSLRRRISAMYPSHLRLRGLRTAVASGAALVLFAITLGLPVPRLMAQASTPVVRVVTIEPPPAVRRTPVVEPGDQQAALDAAALDAVKKWKFKPAPRPSGQGQAAQTDPAYNIGNGISTPVLVVKIDPTYTGAALAAKIEGEVWLDVVIERDGTLSTLRIAKSLDPTLGLDQAALDAASKWKFKPGMKDGQPVRVAVQLILEFRLKPRQAADVEFGKSAYKDGAPGLVLPIAKFRSDPTYTSDAMRAKIQGTVKVEAVVEVDGTVGSARIVESLDQTYGLDESSLRAAKQWTFQPGTLDGRTVPVIVTLTLEFRLR